MSQIAEALAKAKERTGKGVLAAPEGAASLSPDQVERDARRRQRLWVLVLAAALPLTGFVLWAKLRDDTVVAPPAAPAATANAGTQAGGPEWPSAPSPSAPAVQIPVQNPQTVQLVAGLAISAVMPGDPARIMLAGRVVRAGDAIDGGLVFSGVAEGQLRFTDANGVLYTRRY